MLTEFYELLAFFVVVLLVALFTAFARVLASKWGFIEWSEVNLPKPFSQLVSCNFCSAFWLASFVGLILFAALFREVDYPGIYLLTGIFVAPISRLMA